MHPAPVRADSLVRDAVQAMSGMVQDEEAVLEVGETTGCEVFADQDAIVQVLSNLIENGIKYGRAKDEGRSRVVVSAREISEPTEEVSPLTGGDIIAHESRPLASGARGCASPNNT